MLTLEESICRINHIKESKLWTAAQKAYNTPDNGIQITNPAAYHVIKDCAYISMQYLPLFIISKLGNPFSHYKKQITLDQIKDFCSRSLSDPITNQLLVVLLDKAKTHTTELDRFYDNSDPYNDFDERSLDNQKLHTNILTLAKAFEII